jgi:hypothetical protein
MSTVVEHEILFIDAQISQVAFDMAVRLAVETPGRVDTLVAYAPLVLTPGTGSGARCSRERSGPTTSRRSTRSSGLQSREQRSSQTVPRSSNQTLGGCAPNLPASSTRGRTRATTG